MLLAAKVAPPDPTHNIWVVVGVPVLVALIGAAAAVAVAWRASRSSVKNGDSDRKQALGLAREAKAARARDERAETLELIVGQIASLAAQYVDLVRAETAAGSSADKTVYHPHRAALVQALSRIMSRHRDEDVYLGLVGWLHAGVKNLPVAQGAEMLGIFQARVSAWHLEKGTSAALVAILEREEAAMNAGVGLAAAIANQGSERSKDPA